MTTHDAGHRLDRSRSTPISGPAHHPHVPGCSWRARHGAEEELEADGKSNVPGATRCG